MSVLLFLALMAACCGYAGVRGGAPERIAAALQVAAFAATIGVHRLADAAGFRTANLGTGAIDVLLLVALAWLAYRSTRFWPLWLAGWQLASLLAHLGKVIDPSMEAAGYAIQAQFWAYPMLMATAAGAWRHRSRVANGDRDEPWKERPLLI